MSRRTDVIIRTGPDEGTYILIDGHSRLTIGSAYQSFSDAVIAAKRFAGGGTVWRQTVDSRGMPLGAPTPVSIEFT